MSELKYTFQLKSKSQLKRNKNKISKFDVYCDMNVDCATKIQKKLLRLHIALFNELLMRLICGKEVNFKYA